MGCEGAVTRNGVTHRPPVLPGGRGHRKITQNRPYKNIFGGGKFIAVNRPWTGREGSESAQNRPWKICITFPETTNNGVEGVGLSLWISVNGGYVSENWKVNVHTGVFSSSYNCVLRQQSILYIQYILTPLSILLLPMYFILLSFSSLSCEWPLLHTSSTTPSPSPPPPTLFFKSSLYPLCLPFLIYVSSIPEQIKERRREKGR